VYGRDGIDAKRMATKAFGLRPERLSQKRKSI
jgi:hypothetical protein